MRGPAVRVLCAAAIALVSAAACSSSSTAPSVEAETKLTCETGEKKLSAATSYATEIHNVHKCPPPSVLKGTLVAGDTCSRGADCAPACCLCPPGTKSAGMALWMAACSEKKCVAGADACCSDELYRMCNP